ncbi:MAG TPA: hypothetical protein VGS96_15860 [Thermoanaerobaculia bacterium]|nr:hypothetical protein [Thermoanaerobaculia bacterium]
MSDNSLETRLARLEERVAKLEQGGQAILPVRSEQVVARPAETATIDATLIGKSILIIGGAYVLRALTELGVLAPLAGVILALLYALFWIWVADRAMSRGGPIVAMFDAGTAAVITAAVLWEATTRFHLLTVPIASALVVMASLALLFIARRQRSVAMATIAAVMASVTCIGIAIGAADVAGPMIAATIVGIATSWLAVRMNWPICLTLFVAAASDSLAVPLIVMTTMDKVPYGVTVVEVALIVFAVLWMIGPVALGQPVVAALIGLGGGAIVAAFHGGHPTAIATVCFVISAVAYFAAFARARTALLIVAAIATAIGSLLIIEPLAVAIMWAAIAVLSSAIARRFSWDAMSVHAACWAVAAFAAAVRSPIALLVVFTAAAIALWMMARDVARSRLVLLSVATASLILAVASFASFDQRPLPALHRTAILVIVAVILSMISRYVPEATTIARVVLVIAGLKLLVEDLRLGQATMIVVALVLYGGAIVIVARRRAQSGASL